MLLDPKLFRRYHIRAVPALVVTDGNTNDTLYGNLSLTLALQQVATRGEAAVIAKQLLQGAQT